jgi:hypothetical protein
MKRFFKEKYYKASINPKNNAVQRNVDRGLNPFIIDALESVDNLTADRERQLSLCELGIGGGGAHAMLQKHTQDTQVLGVDLFHKANFEYYRKSGSFEYYLDRWKVIAQDQEQSVWHLNDIYEKQEVDGEAYLEATDFHKNKKPLLFHGMDAYKKTTAEHLVIVNGAKLDYVNDDASPHLGALNGLLDAYRDSISDEGILISTGPFGNGTEEAWGRWESGQYLKDLDTLAEQGFVIFDMTEYKQYQHNSYPITEYILSYLAMWSPDFNNYNDLLVKYEHNIIKGKENWKHD